MRELCSSADQLASEIDRQIRRGDLGTDKTVVRPLFGPVAKIVWPTNTAAEIAHIGGASVRTGERWLSGEFEPPPIVAFAMMAEIFRRN